MENGAATLQNSLIVPHKVNKELSYEPAISLLGIYPREVKQRSTWKCVQECS